MVQGGYCYRWINIVLSYLNVYNNLVINFIYDFGVVIKNWK